MHLPHALLLLGPTGSGKTPLGEWLEANGLGGRRCCHLDFGLHLRRIAAGAEVPETLFAGDVAFIDALLDEGALLEDEHFPVAEAILRSFIADCQPDPADLLVLNGLPRHAGQADDVADIVEVAAVIELVCTPERVHARIQANAGGDRTHRVDDSPDAVRRKLATYAQRTRPLVEHYRRLGTPVLALDVDLDAEPGELWERLDQSQFLG